MVVLGRSVRVLGARVGGVVAICSMHVSTGFF